MKLKEIYKARFIALYSLLMLVAMGLAGGVARASTTFSIQNTQQDRIKVSGTVTSATDGTPLPGLSIVIKSTSQGTVTDADGRYSIDAPSNGVLVFSF